MNALRWIVPLFLLLSVSCREIDNIETAYEAEFALPLVDSDIVVSDLIEQIDSVGFVTVDPDGLIRLKFTGDTLFVFAAEIFEEFNNFPSASIPIQINPFPIPISAVNGVDLDTAFLKTGDLIIQQLVNTTDDNLDFILTLPEFLRDGQPFRFAVSLAPGESFTNANQPIDLSDYQIIPESGFVNITYSAIGPVGNPVDLADNLIIQFSEITFSLVYGRFDPLPFSGVTDIIFVDFFDTYIDGQIAFQEPRTIVNVESTIGIPTEVEIAQFTVNPAPSPSNPNPAPISLEPPNQTYSINFPPVLGDTAFTQITIDTSNSNLKDIVSQVPSSVEYTLNGVINPDNEPVIGFSTDTGYIRGIVQLDLPLIGSITDYIARDSIDLELDDLENVRDGSFRLSVANEIPLDMNLTVRFEDNQGNLLLQLLPEMPLVAEGAAVDENGNPTIPTLLVTDIQLSENELDLVKQSSVAILETRFTTTDNPQPVRISDNENANIKIGIRAIVVE